MAKNNAKKRRSGMRIFLGVAAAVGFFGPLAYILVVGVPTQMTKEITLLLGNMMGVSMALIKETFSFYYGSSEKETEQALVGVPEPPVTEGGEA